MKGFSEQTYKGCIIRAVSENMFKSSAWTKNPKQMWSYSIDAVSAGEGFGSCKDAIASAKRLIDQRLTSAKS